MATRRRQRSVLAFAAASLVLGACAASTPRNGFTSANQPRTSSNANTAAAPSPDGATTENGITAGSSGSSGAGIAPRAGTVGGQPAGAANTASSATGGSEPRRASDVGVTADSITIAFSGGFSSPNGAFVSKSVRNGFMTWVDDVNARGGINGRRVIVKQIDNAGTAEGGIAACQEMKSNGSFTAIVSDEGGDGEVACEDNAGIPALATFQTGVNVPWKVARAIQSVPTAGSALAYFMKGSLGATGKKVAIIYLNLPTYKAVSESFKTGAAAIGLNVVASQSVESNQATFVSELTRVRDAGATVVAVVVAAEIVGILRDAKAMGYNPTWTGTPWTLDEISAAARAQMDGIKGLRMAATADVKAYAEFEKVASAQGKTGLGTLDAQMYGYGLILEHYISRAGVNPTRRSFVAAIDSGDPHDNGLNPPLRWSGGKSLGSPAWFPAICCDDQNRWKSLGPASDKTFR